MKAPISGAVAALGGYYPLETTTDRLRAFSAACAVIASLREPTAEMIQAGCAAHPDKPYGSETTLADIVLAEHRAMIDEALK